MKSVAIITRTKNRPVLLRRAIESVLGQSFPDWIHVIVNDGGDEKVVDALVFLYSAQYDGRVHVIHNSNSLGMESASNIGIKSVSSRFISIHDDDDSWESDFLKVAVGYLESNSIPSIKGVVIHARMIREKIVDEEVFLVGSSSMNKNLTSITLPQISEVNVFMPISFVYERSALDCVGYYDENLPVIGDWDFNLRFLFRYDIGVICAELANYHIRVENKKTEYSNSVIKKKYLHDLHRALLINKHVRLLSRNEYGLGALLMFGDYFFRNGHSLRLFNKLIIKVKQMRIFIFARRYFIN